MVKISIILLFLANLAYGQVNITPTTARYYLEVEDKYLLELLKDSVQEELIKGMRNEIVIRQQLIDTQGKAITTLESMVVTKSDQITLKEEEIQQLKKEVRRQKTIKVVSWLGTVLIIIIAI